MTNRDIELLKCCAEYGVTYKDNDVELEEYNHLIYDGYIHDNAEEIPLTHAESARNFALNIIPKIRYSHTLTLSPKGIEALEKREREEQDLLLKTEANELSKHKIEIANNTNEKVTVLSKSVDDIRKSTEEANLIALKAEKKSKTAKLLSIAASIATVGSFIIVLIALAKSCG